MEHKNVDEAGANEIAPAIPSEDSEAVLNGWHQVIFPHERHSWFIGEVIGTHFHVWDAVNHEISERKLLGESPDIRPIPVSHFKDKGAEFHPIYAPDHEVE